MKKIIIFIISIFLIPQLSVDALKCYNKVIDLKSNINNFECTDVLSSNITFKKSENGEDLTNKFKFEIKNNDRIGITVLDRNISFDSSKKTGEIIVSDGHNETSLIFKNNAYVASTTTTKQINSKIVTLSLNPNNGEQIIQKTCEINSNNTFCTIVLPKLDNPQFNGWGTAKTCKEGKTGSERVYNDVTYYACYKNNTEVTTTKKTTTTKNKVSTTTKNEVNTTTKNETSTVLQKELYLKSLSISDKGTSNNISFGTFSIKKYEYEFKVLHEVENLIVNAEATEGIKIEVSGNENLIVGDNNIVIKLTDNENNEKQYILKVKRLNEGEKINNISYLKTLNIGGYKINFNKEQFIYNLTIPSDINKLEITALPENESDKVTTKGNENLEDGSVITIVVNEGMDGSLNYIINITKNHKVNILLIGAIATISVLILLLIILIIVKSNKNKKDNVKKAKKMNNDSIEVLNI